MRDEKIQEVLRQYIEGAITYVEFVRWAWSQVTEEDVKTHNEFSPDYAVAKWPFEG